MRVASVGLEFFGTSSNNFLHTRLDSSRILVGHPWVAFGSRVAFFPCAVVIYTMAIKTSLTTEVLAILCILWGSLFLTRCAASYETDQVCRSGENNECQDRNDENGRVEHGDDEECTLYIAESTIPNAGLGTFTTIPRRIGDLVGMSELCIPYVHFGYSGGTDPFLDYVWNGMTLEMFREHLYHGHLEAFCAGLGSVVNSHSALINAARPRPKYDPFLVRQVHPGAGALTPYHNATSTIVRDIPAGYVMITFELFHGNDITHPLWCYSLLDTTARNYSKTMVTTGSIREHHR